MRAQPAGETSWSGGRTPRVSGSRTTSGISTASPRLTIGSGIGLLVIGASAAPAVQMAKSGIVTSSIRVRMNPPLWGVLPEIISADRSRLPGGGQQGFTALIEAGVHQMNVVAP